MGFGHDVKHPCKWPWKSIKINVIELKWLQKGHLIRGSHTSGAKQSLVYIFGAIPELIRHFHTSTNSSPRMVRHLRIGPYQRSLDQVPFSNPCLGCISDPSLMAGYAWDIRIKYVMRGIVIILFVHRCRLLFIGFLYVICSYQVVCATIL